MTGVDFETMSGEHSRESDVVVITAREIYDRVVATESKVDRLLASLDPLTRRVDEIDGRLGALEAERVTAAPVIAAYPELLKTVTELRIGAARSDWLPRLALGLLGAVIGGVALWLITRGG